MRRLITGLHAPGLFKTLLPLSIILQKTTCKTCCLECWMQNFLKPSDVLPRFGPLHINQQQPKIKLFSSRWVNKVDSSNNITLLVWTLLSDLLVPHKVMGEVKIRNLLCGRKGLICNEPLCEGGLLYGVTLHNLIQIIIVTKVDSLLILKVNR